MRAISWPSRGHLRGVATLGFISALALQSVVAALPAPVHASQYHGTDPTTTPCGDNSRPIKTWRSYYVRQSTDDNYSGAILARIDIRYSRFCNTVWARIENLRTLSTSMSVQMRTYNCALESCQVGTETSGFQTLSPGSTTWSDQLDLPTGTLRGGDRMPPTVEAVGWADIGVVTYMRATGREPVFTQWESNFSNHWYDRDNGSSRILSCENTNEPCKSWGTPGGSWATLSAEFATSFALDGVDEDQDLKNRISDWNYASQNAPLVTVCPGTCPGVEDILVYGLTSATMSAAGEAARDQHSGNLITHAYARFNRSYKWDHGCGSEGDGCQGGGGGLDSRPILSHEWLHVLGFDHCDLDHGVMCHISARNGNDMAEGNMFWTPQLRDVWGLEAAYPD